MKKEKEFWRQNNDDHLMFRFWDKEFSRFCASGNLDYYDDICAYLCYPSDVVLQQCTGCRDKDNTLIFEGDILETDEAGWIGVVVFGDGRFSIEDSKGGFSAMPNWNGCKIIGNVYQNPELIP